MQNSVTQRDAERGIQNFVRFMHIVNTDWTGRPSWYAMTIETDVFYDMLGVDAVAFIRYQGDDYFSMIPVQVKSSVLGLDDYVDKYHQKIGPMGLPLPIGAVVNQHRGEGEVRTRFIGNLQRVRDNNIRYEGYLEYIAGRANSFRKRPPKNESGQQIMNDLLAERIARTRVVQVPKVSIQRVMQKAPVKVKPKRFRWIPWKFWPF